ncbi:MAG: hypothetical protein LBT96_02245 [Campylobacteraceae bacterium]|jgi:hypothetical protein|nr:hypothetical protein [Campylobacteraceae bacterium]
MGDVILKKSAIMMCAFFACAGNVLGSSADIVEYDKFFNEISEVRVGISEQDISGIANPFVVVSAPISQDNNANATAPAFKLNAILENKVKINDTWLAKGSAIDGLRVISIKQNSVVLGNENRAIELFLREKNENSIITIN